MKSELSIITPVLLTSQSKIRVFRILYLMERIPKSKLFAIINTYGPCTTVNWKLRRIPEFMTVKIKIGSVEC